MKNNIIIKAIKKLIACGIMDFIDETLIYIDEIMLKIDKILFKFDRNLIT
jgi:hypothetical protein